MGTLLREGPLLVVAMVEQAGQLAAEGAPLRISPRLVVAIVLVGLALIVWVARSAMAQNTPKDPPTASPRAVTPSPASPSTAVGVPLPSAEPLPPVDSAPTRSLVDSRSLFDLDPGSLRFAAGETDDPENYAQTFVERNRRVAEAQLKSLKDEAEKLRSRLRKLEAGIRRWEALRTALQENEGAELDGAAGGPNGRASLEPQAPAPTPRRRPQFPTQVVPPSADAAVRGADPPPSAPSIDPPSSSDPAAPAGRVEPGPARAEEPAPTPASVPAPARVPR